MFFLKVIWFFLVGAPCWSLHLDAELNSTIFAYQDFGACKRSEYYDLNYFACLPCSDEGGSLKPSANRFSCECELSPTTVATYETAKAHPSCVDICTQPQGNESQACQTEQILKNCKFKYLNATQETYTKSFTLLRLTDSNSNCESCDLKYNFRYQDYCIANALLKRYLKYNSFWQPTSLVYSTANTHFGDLKYVVYFCLELHNVTACNQLANLCVMSHFSLDKNSPCSVFLMTQASDAVLRFADMDDQMQRVLLKPFLFYKKGKQTAKMLSKPMAGGGYSTGSDGKRKVPNRLQFFSATYALDGTLKRWGPFKLAHVDLCRPNIAHGMEDFQPGIRFAQPHPAVQCQLTLENLIDLARLYADNNFISLFLNITSSQVDDQVFMQAVPVLIENLTHENGRNQPEDWLLVKRFQFIEAHLRQTFTAHSNLNSLMTYSDAYKLQLYRQIRYVERLEIHYHILDNNRIAIPIVRMRFRNIDLTSNSTLNQLCTFDMSIKYTRAGDGARPLMREVALTGLILLAFLGALFRAYNARKRRIANDICDVSFYYEFLLHLVSYVANALLGYFLLHVLHNSCVYLSQRTVTIAPPIEKEPAALELIIYAATALKLAFCCIHFWRISHFGLFFIDWERPKSYDNNHINWKTNLETSSVCSSVRTFVSENNVSAWRIIFTANEWIRLSAKQQTSTILQIFVVLVTFQLVDSSSLDFTLKLFLLILSYGLTYAAQLLTRALVVHQILGSPLQRFVDLCSLANISVFALLEPSYGFYLHGRSPHGFSDTDMSSIVMQLERESQNMCGKRGLLSDSDQQTYIMLPPTNLRTYFQKLLIPFQRSHSISQAHFQKESSSIEGNLERISVAFSSVNRFFCAFIDHAIKDMDYIIKDRTFLEKVLSCELDHYLTENKGTFYIDKSYSFSQLFLYGNHLEILIMELLLLISLYMLTLHIIASVLVVCLMNKLFVFIFRHWVLQNVAAKTMIDKRFLM